MPELSYSSNVGPYELNFEFRTPEQKQWFKLTNRNQMISGGFGSGKTYVLCQKCILLLATYPFYRIAIFRYEESKLRDTTMKTFYKICPPWLYDEKFGGNRADSRNSLRLINGSEVIWMNLKDTDEGLVRGLEVNSVAGDQLEEITEHMWGFISVRVERWDMAQVPQYLLDKNPNWPRNKHGKPKLPAYAMGACNPDSELHWIYRRFHPDSEDYQRKWKRNYYMVECATTTATVSEEAIEEMMDNDEAWIQRYLHGKWGIPGGQIHKLHNESLLSFDQDFVDNHPGSVLIDDAFLKKIISKGRLFRSLDHGDASPTAVGWMSAFEDNHINYREYYQPERLIGYHRKRISELSPPDEHYISTVCDPALDKKMAQKYGTRWSTIDEYADPNLTFEFDKRGRPQRVPAINLQPADNNEFATRNRISELLRPTAGHKHPVTGESPAPRLYFIVRSDSYPDGAAYSWKQLRAQKREKIGTIEGKDIYSDERDENVVDHAYDYLRYYIAEHATSANERRAALPLNSFLNVRRELKLYQAGKSTMFARREEFHAQR